MRTGVCLKAHALYSNRGNYYDQALQNMSSKNKLENHCDVLELLTNYRLRIK